MAEELIGNRRAVAPATDISADIERFAALGVLGTLLADRSTGGNIIWASNVFSDKGESYAPEDEIFVRDITGDNAGIIRTRASKGRDDQVALTRAHAEVFTPLWVVRKMVDCADTAWYETHEACPTLWRDYVRSPRLEITCGEAPYLATRYDAVAGTRVPVYRRCGVLDRKLIQITEHVRSRRSWVRHALAALRSTYGYEYQGDNLLIARVNLMATMEDFLDTAGWDPYTPEEYQQIAEVISWNLWQMDGLKDCVPNGALGVEEAEMRLPGFDELQGMSGGQMEIGIARGRGTAKIFDWQNGHEVEFQALKREVTLMDNGLRIKFDYIIGNPPYQEESKGANANDTPIYHYFYDAAFEISDVVELISPARFLFKAGGTPKAWNEKMLNDDHLKVVMYEQKSSVIFPNTDIKGGVAVLLRDANRTFGRIEAFTPYVELNAIKAKVNAVSTHSLMEVITNRGLYRYSDLAYSEQPEAMSRTADRRIAPSSFARMPELFTTERPHDGFEYVQILGRNGNQRIFKWFRKSYVKYVRNLDLYKVVVPKANGSGTFGEPLAAPLVLSPNTGFTETYISIGETDNERAANAVLKYVKTKFLRAMLGILKVTQNNAKPSWAFVPLQDFTAYSDIDWSQTVADIDRQLYAKYGLTQDEIDFIESHVKEMQ